MQLTGEKQSGSTLVENGMNRRQILSSLAGLSIGLCVPDCTVRGSARAQEPMSAIAIASTVLSAASHLATLFRAAGPGPAQLQQLQADMLAVISDELHQVNDELLQILDNFIVLKELLREVPDAVVATLYRNSVTAQETGYLEVLKTYQAKLSQSGIQEAQRVTKDELRNNVIAEVRKARLNLQANYVFASIPYVCSAAYVETHCMILVNEDPLRIGAAIDTYRAWLKDILYGRSGIPSIRDAIIDETSALAHQKNVLRQGELASCSASLTPTNETNGRCAGTGSMTQNACSIGHVVATFVPLAHGPLKDVSADTYLVNQMSAAARPIESHPTFERESSRTAFHCDSTHTAPKPAWDSCPADSWATSCADLEKKLPELYKTRWDALLELQSSKVVSLYALKQIADSTKGFLDDLQSKL